MASPRAWIFNMQPVANLWEMVNSGVLRPLYTSKAGKRDRPQARSLRNFFFLMAWTQEWHEDEERRQRVGGRVGRRERGQEGRKTLGQRSELGDQLAEEQEKQVWSPFIRKPFSHPPRAFCLPWSGLCWKNPPLRALSWQHKQSLILSPCFIFLHSL